MATPKSHHTEQYSSAGRRPKDERAPERVSLRLNEEERVIVGKLSITKTFYGSIRLSATAVIRGLIRKAGQR